MINMERVPHFLMSPALGGRTDSQLDTKSSVSPALHAVYTKETLHYTPHLLFTCPIGQLHEAFHLPEHSLLALGEHVNIQRCHGMLVDL